MKLKNATIKQLTSELAKRIAEEHLEVNEELAYAAIGIEEKEYLLDAGESVEWYCNSQLPETVFPLAIKHYNKLVQKL